MKFGATDILFTLFVGPIPPSMFKIDPPKVEEKPLEVPETEVGSPIPVIFGTVEIPSPKVVWYGDVTIKKVKVDTGGKK